VNHNKSTNELTLILFFVKSKILLRHTAGLNISGSFLLGVISAMPTVDVDKINQFQYNKPFERFQGLSPRAKLMLGVGFCGSFTTFSTFSCDVVTWVSQGQITRGN